jgi:hypothetical protein
VASEARRAAHALVATRAQVFASDFPLTESIERLAGALRAIEAQGASRAAVRGTVAADRVMLFFGRQHAHRSQCTYEGAWLSDGDAVRLDGTFIPAVRTQRFLASTSIVLSILLAASLWVIFAPGQDAPTRILVPMVTVLAILAFPFVVVAMASHREVEELAIAKAVGRTLAPQPSSPRT